MEPIRIIGHIMANTGMYVPDFAKHEKISKATLYLVINGKSSNGEIRDIVSKTINFPISDIWPERPEMKEGE